MESSIDKDYSKIENIRQQFDSYMDEAQVPSIDKIVNDKGPYKNSYNRDYKAEKGYRGGYQNNRGGERNSEYRPRGGQNSYQSKDSMRY